MAMYFAPASSGIETNTASIRKPLGQMSCGCWLVSISGISNDQLDTALLKRSSMYDQLSVLDSRIRRIDWQKRSALHSSKLCVTVDIKMRDGDQLSSATSYVTARHFAFMTGEEEQ